MGYDDNGYVAHMHTQGWHIILHTSVRTRKINTNCRIDTHTYIVWHIHMISNSEVISTGSV